MASESTANITLPCCLPYAATEGFCFPYQLREVIAPGRRQRVKELEDEDERLEEEHPALFCRACSHTITTGNQRIEVSGSHRHTFFNPVGIVYELGCFGSAPGCSLVGESSAEFSWFPGCVWRIALCRKCGVHLGWRFQSAELSFYGLILAHLQGGGE